MLNRTWLAPLAALVFFTLASAANAVNSQAPTPLPVGADGLPLMLQTVADTLAPGEARLVAVKAAGSNDWYLPQDTDAHAVAPGIIARPR